MKKTVISMISGIIIGGMVFGGIGTASALNAVKNIKVSYENIKMVVDGVRVTPTDANGNIIEPFTYNGTTYVPIRTVAQALKKDVGWDGNTSTVYIGARPGETKTTYLSDLQYSNLINRDDEDSEKSTGTFQKLLGTMKGADGKVYDNGLFFELDSTYLKVPILAADYPLNGKCQTLSGTILLPKEIKSATGNFYNSFNEAECGVQILGDGVLLYDSPAITRSALLDFKIDVSGVNTITIKVYDIKNSWSDNVVALTNLLLQ